jgi:hypothetical protein
MSIARNTSTDFVEQQIERAFMHIVNPMTPPSEIQAWSIKMAEWHKMRVPAVVAEMETVRGLRKAMAS